MADILNWRGQWSAVATYQVFDVVYYSGSSYVAIDINTNASPTAFPGTKWDILALSGGVGLQGAQGVRGAQGIHGVAGAQGPAGPVGSQGATGTQGATGADGEQGHQGDQGPQGPRGGTGAQGIQGPRGLTTLVPGPVGAQGQTGSQGAQGTQGLRGLQGVKGDKGDRGATGATGAVGLRGISGEDGRGFVWRNDWLNSITYNQYDVVGYTNSTTSRIYICIAPGVLNVSPDSDISKWNLMVGGLDTTSVMDGGTW